MKPKKWLFGKTTLYQLLMNIQTDWIVVFLIKKV